MTASFLRRTLAATACALAVAAGPAALAQQPMQQGATQQAQPTPAQQAAIARDMKTVAEYRLPKDFFTRMMPVIEQIRQSRISPPETPNMSLEETIKRTEAMPALQPILQHNGMSAREFVMGITTFGLTSAVMQHPAQDSKSMPPLNPDNVKLLQSHQAQTQALIQAMGGSEGEGQQSGAPQ
ncbi:hypothetical protein B0W47_12015 [Komagataeibacter nataicola]|uniref:DUF4168 domain-containing protein n=1 Tax=Komagataeibacter nataicola TaxID=265960 RepID=A0A9N7CP01_9PROT|nr:hypothetical protein [Komagataeibacter nataicola]AQU88069.1 hypothetical protein B0W47_12015 [Komagataeibacter nataicola]PYD66942.1 hypothetical protein CDI09_05990 [Komagataeibacter nataicola]WEQ54836.1 hypothetical protein LV564_11780 [Komagataeibacter nataicola]WNM09174.1 hypothetical protein RI056_03915 [Komagataeibacter nataicola]GBR17587.1 hypothetical protein AA0616_1089 [Komagataeibacter nataicola NRIC 0616]